MYNICIIAVRGGLTFREGNYICEALSATGKLAGYCFNTV